MSKNSETKTESSSTRAPNELSAVEEIILNSKDPIQIEESTQITLNGYTGIWANKFENLNWQEGPIPLENYPIFNEQNPELIQKKQEDCVKASQQIIYRFLKPARAPEVGDLIIKKEADRQPQAAPPIIIRVPPKENKQEQEQIVIREIPPKIKAPQPAQTITIPGEVIPAGPRRLIVEKMPKLPKAPGKIIVERWLNPDRLINITYEDNSKSAKIIRDDENLQPEYLYLDKKENLAQLLAEYEAKHGQKLIISNSEVLDEMNDDQKVNASLLYDNSYANNDGFVAEIKAKMSKLMNKVLRKENNIRILKAHISNKTVPSELINKSIPVPNFASDSPYAKNYNEIIHKTQNEIMSLMIRKLNDQIRALSKDFDANKEKLKGYVRDVDLFAEEIANYERSFFQNNLEEANKFYTDTNSNYSLPVSNVFRKK